jgi:hypothetical protein
VYFKPGKELKELISDRSAEENRHEDDVNAAVDQ